jgi:hypothetical protein
MPEDIKAGKKADFDEYITKPIKIDRFCEIIDQILMRKPVQLCYPIVFIGYRNLQQIVNSGFTPIRSEYPHAKIFTSSSNAPLSTDDSSFVLLRKVRNLRTVDAESLGK